MVSRTAAERPATSGGAPSTESVPISPGGGVDPFNVAAIASSAASKSNLEPADQLPGKSDKPPVCTMNKVRHQPANFPSGYNSSNRGCELTTAEVFSWEMDRWLRHEVSRINCEASTVGELNGTADGKGDTLSGRHFSTRLAKSATFT